MSLHIILAVGMVQACIIAVLAIVLHTVRQRVGLTPLLYLCILVAVAVPFTVHLASQDAHGEAPNAYAVFVPVFVGVVLLAHTLLGAWTAVHTALSATAGGVIAAVFSGASHTLPTNVDVLLPPAPAGAALAGVSLTLGALAAIYLYEGLVKVPTQLRLTVLFVAAALAGVGVQGFTAAAATYVGLTPAAATWPAIPAIPLLVGLVPVAFLGTYSDLLTEGLGPAAREIFRDGRFAHSHRSSKAKPQTLDQEESVRLESQAWVQDLQGHMGRYMARPDGQLLSVDPGMAKLLGMAPEKLKGMNVTQLFARPTRTGKPELATWARDPGSYTFDLHGEDGRVREVELIVATTKDGYLYGQVRPGDPTVFDTQRASTPVTPGDGLPGRVPNAKRAGND
ncbi:MAG: PAS domain S-box protein [Candidatus Thermoplasmatota archaeon]|nr:PAS domain S-box protein [Candidatus Thermoplasmatota archaeon]